MEFGPEIKCDGVRPEWYRGEHIDWMRSDGFCKLSAKPYHGIGTSVAEGWSDYEWQFIEAIRPPANHPYYLAVDQGMTYWPGGEEPDDWDRSEVLTRGGWFAQPGDGAQWGHCGGLNVEIIGYRKQVKKIAGSKIYIGGKPLNFDFSDLTWTEIGAVEDMGYYDGQDRDRDEDDDDDSDADIYTVTLPSGAVIKGVDLAYILRCIGE